MLVLLPEIQPEGAAEEEKKKKFWPKSQICCAVEQMCTNSSKYLGSASYRECMDVNITPTM